MHLEFPAKVIFDGVTLGVGEGDRTGIVGRNGDGKSTLLSVLAGRIEPDAGQVTARRGTAIGVLDQSDTLDPTLTVERAIVGDKPEYEWAGDARVRDIIDGLVAELPWHGKIGDLSGGQRRRVALAGLLTQDFEVLMLDEPTNHLDVEAIAWLASHLKQRWSSNSGALLVVTHDRWFLDEVSTLTWEVHDHTVDAFEGGYSAYVLQRVERDRMAAATEAKRQNLMRKELAWLRRGPPARTSKPKFRIDAANALIADEPPLRDSVALERMATSRLGKDVIDLLDVSVSYGDNEVLRNIEWRIGPGERAGILGVNGAGKSTLLNLITGALSPTTGVVKRGKTVKVATLTQQSHELLSIHDERVLDVIERKRTSYRVGDRDLSASQLLERLGFNSSQLRAHVGELSGGQLRRLNLLMILLDEPNVLVLDEPSNDLDTDMLAAMEDLLDSWPGTLIVVSHDRYLIERVTDQQYALIDGSLQHLTRGVEQYLELRGRTSVTSKRVTTSPPVDSERVARKLSNTQRQAAQKELASVERKLTKVPLQIEQLNARIEVHDQADYIGLSEMVEQQIALRNKQSELETRWLELSEQLD